MSDILQQKIIKGLRLKNLDLKEENDRLRNLCQQLFIERKNPQVRILNLKDVKNFIFKNTNTINKKPPTVVKQSGAERSLY